MSSTESSGAPAEATATTQPAGFPAAASSFGTSRGSGLARGKRTSSSHAPATAAAPTEYTPTAIEIINAPREYKNPFAPADAVTVASVEPPVAVVPEIAPVVPAPVAPKPAPSARAHVSPAPAGEMFPLEEPAASAPVAEDEKAELNILPPEQQKAVAHQTWESDGFQPSPASPRERDQRNDRPRRDDRRENDRRNEQPVPSKFRYERAKDGPLPPRPAAPAAAAPAPVQQKSGGFLGWLKSLFAGKPAENPVEARNGSAQPEGREGHHHRRHRGGRDRGNFRGQGGGQPQSGSEGRGQGNEYGEQRDGGYRRRRRGGRGRGGFNGDRRGGQGGPSAT